METFQKHQVHPPNLGLYIILLLYIKTNHPLDIIYQTDIFLLHKPLLMKSNPVEQLCHNSVLAEFKFNFHSYPQDFLC